jgi:hypothetical protein
LTKATSKVSIAPPRVALSDEIGGVLIASKNYYWYQRDDLMVGLHLPDGGLTCAPGAMLDKGLAIIWP